jgi:hypothetical protein
MSTTAIPEQSSAQAWRRVGRSAGYLAGIGLFVGTLLFLLDALNALGASPDYHGTAAGPIQDEANFWVAYFAHQRHILWDIIARDSLFPLAFVALIVLSLAIGNLVGYERPQAQLMVMFFVVGGVLSALADLIYLGGTEYWRVTGWSADPPARMVSVGRSSTAVEALTRWPEAAGFLLLAAALVFLGRLAGTRPQLSSRLTLLVNVEALLLVGIAVAGVMQSDTAYNIFSLLTGALVGPAVALGLGRHFGRPATNRPIAETAPAAR